MDKHTYNMERAEKAFFDSPPKIKEISSKELVDGYKKQVESECAKSHYECWSRKSAGLRIVAIECMYTTYYRCLAEHGVDPISKSAKVSVRP